MENIQTTTELQNGPLNENNIDKPEDFKKLYILNFTPEVKSLTIMKDGGEYNHTFKENDENEELPKFSFDYEYIQFSYNEQNGTLDKGIREYYDEKEDQWYYLTDDVYNEIKEYFDNFELPNYAYPQHYIHKINNFIGKLYNYLYETNQYVIDLVEDNTPIPEDIRTTRRLVKKYQKLITEDMTEKDFVLTADKLLKESPIEICDCEEFKKYLKEQLAKL